MKHIMLFFLSKIHKTKTQEFQHSFYKMNDGSCFDCIQTNESAIDYLSSCLAKTNERLEALFYFTTNLTRETLPVLIDGNCYEKTHEEWFKQRITEKNPLLQDKFYGIPYDETKDTDESIRQVMLMAERIKEYMAAYPDEEIYLHADMTGGFRHASMMMLSVMQLLKFSGIRIGNVVYSNWQRGVVEDVTEVHRMFTLVSGTDEFVNFGSVTEIQQYFKDRAKTPALENLLITMQEFSDAVKICRTSKIETLVHKLRQSITDFSAETEKPLHEELFSQIITILGKEYGKLLEPDVTRIDIIRWCVSKGFLQQAMTLCTEWLPFVLVEKKICYTDDPKIIKEAEKEGKSMGRSWEQSFIIGYKHNSVVIDSASPLQTSVGKLTGKHVNVKSLTGNTLMEKQGFREAVAAYRRGCGWEASASQYPQGKAQLMLLFNEMDTFPYILPQVAKQELTVDEFSSRAPMIYRTCFVLWQCCKDMHKETYKEEFEKFLLRLKGPLDLLKRMETLPKNYYEALLQMGQEEDSRADETRDDFAAASKKTNGKSKEKLSLKWLLHKRKQYLQMLQSGVMKTNYPDKVMYFLGRFYEIREERNNVNHATEDGKKQLKTNQEIETMITEYLDALNKIG